MRFSKKITLSFKIVHLDINICLILKINCVPYWIFVIGSQFPCDRNVNMPLFSCTRSSGEACRSKLINIT